jgi:hypothetical protein
MKTSVNDTSLRQRDAPYRGRVGLKFIVSDRT